MKTDNKMPTLTIDGRRGNRGAWIPCAKRHPTADGKYYTLSEHAEPEHTRWRGTWEYMDGHTDAIVAWWEPRK